MEHNRREFLKQSIGLTACCLLSTCPNLLKGGTEDLAATEMESYIEKVSKEITYCVYRCTKECPWLVASLKDDEKGMKEMGDRWSKNHGDRIIPEGQGFCYGCNPVGKPLGHVVSTCTVRKCAIEKGFSSCLECEDLADCDKELWTLYPQHREYVLGKQKAMKKSESKE